MTTSPPSQRFGVDTFREFPLLIRVRNIAAMVLAAASRATDAIGYLTMGHVFTSAMTGNLVLLGISIAHRDGQRRTCCGVALLFCGRYGSRRGWSAVRNLTILSGRRQLREHSRSKPSHSWSTRPAGGPSASTTAFTPRRRCSDLAQSLWAS